MKLSCLLLALGAVASTGEAGRWDWYTGKSNKMPPAMKYTMSDRARKSRMSKIVGPKDSIGTMLGGAIVNHFFDEDGDDDLGGWGYYTGKSNKVPPALKYWGSKKAQKSRMNKVVGPRDSIGTALGSAIVGSFFDEDADDDLGGAAAAAAARRRREGSDEDEDLGNYWANRWLDNLDEDDDLGNYWANRWLDQVRI